MKIILGSENPSKKRAIELALRELGVSEVEIICVKSEPSVSSRPIGYEIIKGADNRNKSSREYALKNKIDFDYLCAIEGGFSLDENGLPFVVTYSIVESANGKKSTGKSIGLRLQKDVFNFIRDGGSLNEVIGKINNSKKNEQNQGITGYLSRGIFKRDKFDKDAVISAFIPVIFSNEREMISSVLVERLK